MYAKKCDRCGKLYEIPKQPREYKLASCSQTKSHYRRDIDICDKCYKELKEWYELPQKDKK